MRCLSAGSASGLTANITSSDPSIINVEPNATVQSDGTLAIALHSGISGVASIAVSLQGTLLKKSFEIEVGDKTANLDARSGSLATVSFDSNGGSRVPSAQAEIGCCIEKPSDPIKNGFDFLGWFIDPEFSEEFDFSSPIASSIVLYAKWKEREQKPAPVFTDVDYSSWYGDAVTFVAEKGLITGYSGTTLFGVGDVLTRAQLATILWRNACPDEYASYDPETAKDTTGIDGSADGMYYTAAANWAVRNGVITGFDREDGTKDFAADDDVSFEQLITILSRLCATDAELSAAGSDLSAFADGYLASDWSRGAFAWAADKGLVQGYDEPAGKFLRPGDPVARERVAVVLARAFEMDILK